MKLKLNELKLQSFVTSLEEAHKRTVVGGDASADYGGCTPGFTYNYNNCSQGTQAATGYPCAPCNGGGNGSTDYFSGNPSCPPTTGGNNCPPTSANAGCQTPPGGGGHDSSWCQGSGASTGYACYTQHC